MATRSMMLSDLPDELLEMIVSYMDKDCILTKHLRDEPTWRTTTTAPSDSIALKNFSSTCRRFRAFTLPRLFNCCKIPLNLFEFIQAPTTDNLEFDGTRKLRLRSVDEFLQFITSSKLSSSIKTLLLSTDQTIDTKSYTPLSSFWPTIFSSLQPSTITILAPPSTLAYFTSCEINTRDAWAFQTPLHLLQLRISPDGDRPVPAETDNLFAILPWTHCILNEGSSLRMYNAYEYHSLVAPSIFNSCHIGRLSDTCLSQLTSLVSFDYIAIFPPYGQVIKILGFLFSLPKLERVRTQLAPRRENRILEDSTRVLRTLYSDLWMEFEGTYFLIAKHFVENGSKSRVSEFVCLDYQHEGLWESLGHSEGIMSRYWQALGQGHWQRKDEEEIVRVS